MPAHQQCPHGWLLTPAAPAESQDAYEADDSANPTPEVLAGSLWAAGMLLSHHDEQESPAPEDDESDDEEE